MAARNVGFVLVIQLGSVCCVITSVISGVREPSYQLYDIDGDPTETTDIAAKYPDVTRNYKRGWLNGRNCWFPPTIHRLTPRQTPRTLVGSGPPASARKEVNWLVRYGAPLAGQIRSFIGWSETEFLPAGRKRRNGTILFVVCTDTTSVVNTGAARVSLTPCVRYLYTSCG